MLVFIMRHGEATTLSDNDFDRELTDYGREEVSSIIERSIDKLQVIDEIWASPYVRAQQTATLVGDTLNKEIMTYDFLTPTDNPEKIVDALTETDKTVLLVSHQPLVGTLVDKLAGLEPGRHRMSTAAVACVETELFAGECGALLWLHQSGH